MNTEKNNHEAARKLAESLNGNEVEAVNFKLITVTIQDVNPVTFSEKCEFYLKIINPEVMTYYGVQNTVMKTNRGEALVFIACIQYWGTEAEHFAWTDELRRNNLFIKP